jgi:hypothetical protein
MKIDEFTLPTDQAQLSQIIASRITSAQPGTTEYSILEFDYIGLLLQETSAPSDVRAALLTLAGRIPGITLTGPATAPEGVSGVGIATPVPAGGGYSSELVFDPTTGALLASEQWLTDSSGNGTLERWTSYLVSGVVDNTSTTIPVATSVRPALRPAEALAPAKAIYAAQPRFNFKNRSCAAYCWVAWHPT